ncbi:DUF4279 domain-containing protein [Mesorhizobium sp. J428]|uniref:DUF4279 domain-containing protein n=1 Tax=Mesorhizobium sp. J428 TaxID=2898440 RepID=UPI002151A9A6|nr:DUF4279 domain-containing protein [Mesorhizobium sp. J428]MCR5857115.1 DUF4279 domain-containing protein [Mesorhizobium sp. J428]
MAEVVATSATLRIFGERLDPVEISRLLGCSPTSAEKRGEPMGPRGNISARQGGWKLRIERQDGAHLSDQISQLLAETSSDHEVWTDLVQRYRVDMFCGIWLDEPGQGVNLAPMVLVELGRRGISLELDIYYADAHPVTK